MEGLLKLVRFDVGCENKLSGINKLSLTYLQLNLAHALVI